MVLVACGGVVPNKVCHATGGPVDIVPSSAYRASYTKEILELES